MTSPSRTLAEKGRLVVGADGRHSHVARSVHASESNTKPPLQGTDFIYWSGVPTEGFEFHARGYRAAYAWLKHENLARIGINWMGKDFVRDERPVCLRHGLEVLRQPLEDGIVIIASTSCYERRVWFRSRSRDLSV
jgi:2-polyprenyl-6-methoxyphenol hydroxylase-like FAD-dependent oxidoreductase